MLSKILIVFGTRPEAIKMAPVIMELQKYPELFEVLVCVTGQHREMLDQVLRIFEIEPNYDLNIMKKGQSLNVIIAKVMEGLREILLKETPNMVLVHGDTITSTAAAMASFYERIPVGHIEAGLRTNDIYSPWPEEMNRQMTSRIATLHFAPTVLSRDNLIKENINEDRIIVTGNTVIDSLLIAAAKLENNKNNPTHKLSEAGYNVERLQDGRKMVLITGHRRENFGEGFKNICNAILELAINNTNVDFVYPVHLNPNVQEVVFRILGNDSEKKNVFLIKPVEYLEFVELMNCSYIILTDSGGIQEEAPSLGKPVLVMRDTTERPEAVDSGVARLVGTDTEKIINGVELLLSNPDEYNLIAHISNPYGDGTASKKIVSYLCGYFKLKSVRL
ncbi:MAG: UDP-N-acetylglucosamine 2-epimerase (non-hydrolyzing) [Bacteroidales bacterium]|nr:UDP-N-acetylglucosamine 2-epimerase (non-hydrolyzing) [Bacteroidales bacterium]MCF8389637.1 UDP-N-acetylglucosamine 2-epimerase (non-hydrolyzing) [Bacteroidales bacterium]